MAVARLRRPSVVIAILAIGAFHPIGQSAHYRHVEHSVCLAHGGLAHGDDDHAPLAFTIVSAPDEGTHEDCERDALPSPSLRAAEPVFTTPMATAIVVERARPVASPAVAIARYLIAPKQSPPV
jgi:hypothetical protein